MRSEAVYQDKLSILLIHTLFMLQYDRNMTLLGYNIRLYIQGKE